MRIFFINLKRNILPFSLLIFTLLLVVFSNSNILAVKTGINIWFNNLVPSLFPFFIAVELLNYTNIPSLIGKLFNKIMRPLFNVPGIGAYALFMGIISGYPVGAKIVTDLRNNNLCTKEEGERLLTFTNNSGPLFIIGSVGISLFNDSSIGFLLLFTHLLACISVAFIFRFWKNSNSSIAYNSHQYATSKHTTVTFSNLGSVLSESITNSISTILLIGGFVVIFSSVISILKSSGILSAFSTVLSPMLSVFNIDSVFASPLISGFLEITNGINSISNISSKKLSINLIFTAFLLGWGGISVLLQVFSITSKSDLSIRPYIYGKLLHGVFAAFYTYVFISFIPFFNFDL